MIYSYTYQSPIGSITLSATKNALVECSFGYMNKDRTVLQTDILQQAWMELKEYFDGRRCVFTVPMNPIGTDFQKKVWQALLQIPYGQTVSYKEIAVAIGNEKACRAVGMANNRNPIGIFIPCHRVVGANGTLVGYAGGLDKKQALLMLENRYKDIINPPANKP